MSPLTEVLEELTLAGLAPTAVNGHHEALCPRCDGTLTIGPATGGGVAIDCSKGCSRAKIADSLHFRTHAARTRPRVAEVVEGQGNVAGPPTHDRYAGRVLDTAALLAAPDEPIPWRCEGLVADGFLTVLAGAGGQGKSWLALALACGVARGKPAAGIDCAKGRAVIFDAENGRKLTGRRLRAARVSPDLAVQPVDAGGLRLSRDMGWFREIAEQQNADLVIFDSLRVLSSGSKESDGDEMEPLVTSLKELARDTGAAVLLIHHRGKSESSEYRGSSVILDQTDLLFTLGRVAGDPEGRHRRKVATVKCRIDEEPAERWVAIEADRARGLVFVNAAEPYIAGSDRPRDGHREQVLAALAAGLRSDRKIAERTHIPRSTVQRIRADLGAEQVAQPVPSGPPPGPPANPHSSAETDVVARGAHTPRREHGGPPPEPARLRPVDPDLFTPNGSATCDGCGARLTHFGGRLVCIGCESRGGAA